VIWVTVRVTETIIP